MSDAVFMRLLASYGIPTPEVEYRFAWPYRKWRFDYAFPAHLVALEVEGGAYVQGRHTRGAGYVADLEKYSVAAVLGWRLIRVTPAQLCTPRTFGWIRHALGIAPPMPLAGLLARPKARKRKRGGSGVRKAQAGAGGQR